MSRRPKGSGAIRERDGRHEASYSFSDASGKRRRRSKRFDTRTEARKWLTLRTAEVESREVADSGRIRVGDYLTDWLGSLGLNSLEPATLAWYSDAVVRHIIPVLGGRRLDRLTPVMIEAFLAEKAKNGRLDGKGGLGPTSIRRLRVTLHKSLDHAVRVGLLNTNPVDRVDSPKMPAHDVTIAAWTLREIETFIELARPDRLAAVWRLAATTGLRRQELCGLKWSDIDLAEGRLSVRRAVVIPNGGRIRVKPPKTASSRRTVDIDTGTVATLAAWKESQDQEHKLAGTAWTDEDWIVADELGRLIRPDRISKRFSEIVKDSNLNRITLRQLRHSHATVHLWIGSSPKVVQERLGHSSIKTTLDTYSAVLPNMQREAVERFAEALEGSLGGE